jgi:hypothetical protein
MDSWAWAGPEAGAARFGPEAVGIDRRCRELEGEWACWSRWETGGTARCQAAPAEADMRRTAALVVMGRRRSLAAASVEQHFLAAVT